MSLTKFMRIGERGHEIPVVATQGSSGERWFDLRSLTDDVHGEFLRRDGVSLTRSALAADELPPVDPVGRRIGAPIARPHAVVCVGMNYAAHAAESGAEPPAVPVIFMKMPNTIIGPHDNVLIAPEASEVDWEVELGVVIKKPAYRLVNRDQARDVIGGYVTANDLSERRSQLRVSGGQWSKGKNHPGFLPLGPWLRPADEVEPHGLSLRSWVNGALRQDSTTSDMIFGVEDILMDLTRYMRFEPGDVILTGTPQGVALSGRYPYLTDGDVVEVAVEGLGNQRQQIGALA